jgi:hypothetical protein
VNENTVAALSGRDDLLEAMLSNYAQIVAQQRATDIKPNCFFHVYDIYLPRLRLVDVDSFI